MIPVCGRPRSVSLFARTPGTSPNCCSSTVRMRAGAGRRNCCRCATPSNRGHPHWSRRSWTSGSAAGIPGPSFSKCGTWRAVNEMGAGAELRRRTGAEEALVHTRVQDDEYYRVGELTLGGRSVRDGHAAILTDLEELLGIRASFEELMARALHHDQDHTAWGRATILLAHRRDRETWEAAAALRARSGPSHRLFGAEVLRLTHLFDDSDADAFSQALPWTSSPTGRGRRRTSPSSPRC